MIVEEFEGKTEQEAIELAIQKLGLKREDIDVEIVQSRKAGLFRSGNVRIRVHVGDEDEEVASDGPQNEQEKEAVAFLEELLEKMGFDAKVTVSFREEGKIGLDVESDNSAILIGKQGSTLEAVQFIVNLVAQRLGMRDTRIIVDAEDYRVRRQKNLIRSAKRVAQQVRSSGQSQLLEPMNPYERRLVHTALAQMKDIATISEGDGLYKRIRVCYRDERLNER